MNQKTILATETSPCPSFPNWFPMDTAWSLLMAVWKKNKMLAQMSTLMLPEFCFILPCCSAKTVLMTSNDSPACRQTKVFVRSAYQCSLCRDVIALGSQWIKFQCRCIHFKRNYQLRELQMASSTLNIRLINCDRWSLKTKVHANSDVFQPRVSRTRVTV